MCIRDSNSGELVLVSRCCFGGPGPFVKNVLDRCISYVHPYFVIKNGEMHHRQPVSYTHLDDVMSELDAGRQHYLLNRLDGRQVFLTCCEPGAVKRLEEGALFEVRRGEIYVPTSGDVYKRQGHTRPG